MTKEELKQEAEKFARTEMSHPNEYGQYYCTFLKVAEPREKHIAELEAEVKEWKDKADLWCKTAKLKDHNIMINKELEKENAELKKRVDNLYNSDCWASEQLTKARCIIASFVKANTVPDLINIKAEAEQFLKDSEVEK